MHRVYKIIQDARERLARSWSARATADKPTREMTVTYDCLMRAEEAAFKKGWDRGRQAGYHEHRIEELQRRAHGADNPVVKETWERLARYAEEDIVKTLEKANGESL